MSSSTIDIMNRGMSCLVDQLGIIETEHFISTIIREKFDYTKWQREHFSGRSVRELLDAAEEYERNHSITQPNPAK